MWLMVSSLAPHSLHIIIIINDDDDDDDDDNSKAVFSSPISENRNTTTPNNTEQILTQENKIDLENVNKIMNEQKTTLPS